jgi:hypothetical protein
VSDPSGIAEVWAEVQKPDGTRERVGMSSVGGRLSGAVSNRGEHEHRWASASLSGLGAGKGWAGQ